MEIVFGIACVAFVLLIGYHCLKESDSQRRFKEKQAERMRDIQAERARQTAAAYDRQRAPRSAPVTTGTSRPSTGSTPVKTEVKRHDNSFENVVDTYTTPTYSSSHKSSSCSGGGGYSGGDSGGSSSSDSSSGGCD